MADNASQNGWLIALRIGMEDSTDSSYTALLTNKCHQLLQEAVSNELSVKKTGATQWQVGKAGLPPPLADLVQLSEALYHKLTTYLVQHQQQAIRPLSCGQWPVQLMLHYGPIPLAEQQALALLQQLDATDSLLITYELKLAHRQAPRYENYLQPEEGQAELGELGTIDYQWFNLSPLRKGIPEAAKQRVPKPYGQLTEHEKTVPLPLNKLLLSLSRPEQLQQLLQTAIGITDELLLESGNEVALDMNGQKVSWQVWKLRKGDDVIVTEALKPLGPFKEVMWRWQLTPQDDQTTKAQVTIGRQKKGLLSTGKKAYAHLWQEPFRRIQS